MAGPQFNAEFDPRYGELVDISPMLRRIVCKNPSMFTFHGTGTYVIGHGDVAIVDPGPRDQAHIEALLQALDGETVRHILITHTHGDHSPASAAIADATGAPVLGYGPHPSHAGSEGSNTDDDDDDDDDDDQDDAATETDPSGGYGSEDPEFAEKHRVDTDFDPESPLRHGDVIEGPGYTIEALHTPGHISNHLCFALQEENAVLSGDHVMGWSTTIIPPPDGDVAAYLQSLQVLIDRPQDQRLYPTHGDHIDDHHRYVEALLAHRLSREAGILKQLQGGPKSAKQIVLELYANVAKHLHKPAARSVVAHLRKLHDEGRAAPAVADASTVSGKTVWELT